MDVVKTLKLGSRSTKTGLLKASPRSSKAEASLAVQLRALQIGHETQFRFSKTRLWRADFRLTGTPFLVEVDGGNRMIRPDKNGIPVAVGRHLRDDDYEKMSWAAILGFRVIRVTPRMVRNGKAVELIEAALKTFKEEREDGPV